MTEVDNLCDFPNELIELIISFAPTTMTFASMARVCKDWSTLARRVRDLVLLRNTLQTKASLQVGGTAYFCSLATLTNGLYHGTFAGEGEGEEKRIVGQHHRGVPVGLWVKYCGKYALSTTAYKNGVPFLRRIWYDRRGDQTTHTLLDTTYYGAGRKPPAIVDLW